MDLFAAFILIALAPLLHGAMRTLRARLEGRPGPPVVQPYRELAKLWGKESVVPEGCSPIVLAAPGIVLGVAITFVAALPFVVDGAFAGLLDVVALGLLLALGRFVPALAALDTRDAFAAMGASREVAFGALVEPVLLVALLGAAALGGGTSMLALTALPFGPASGLAVAAAFIVVLAETARVPIDNQETHYELTMTHEALLLEYGGWQLAMLQLAAFVKQIGFLVLLALLLPGHAWWAHAGWVLVAAVTITLVETAFAKLRLFEVPPLLTTGFVLAAGSIGLRLLNASP